MRYQMNIFIDGSQNANKFPCFHCYKFEMISIAKVLNKTLTRFNL